MTQTQSLRERLERQFKNEAVLDYVESLVRSERAAAWRECREAAEKCCYSEVLDTDGSLGHRGQVQRIEGPHHREIIERIRALEPF